MSSQIEGMDEQRLGDEWYAARSALETARVALAVALDGIARQAPFDRVLAAERRCTRTVHGWLASALQLKPVSDPRLVLSLDVDGVLEDQAAGFSSTSLAGGAALRLLQLGQVAVLLNTARSLADVQQRVDDFKLVGGVAAFGAAIWDGVFRREHCLLPGRSNGALDRLRTILRADSASVLDVRHRHSVRASRVVRGAPAPIPGPDAQQMLDQHSLNDLTYWVSPRHTDFVSRAVDKNVGLCRLRRELGLSSLPLAAMGDGACDLPMLRAANIAFLPAGALATYTASRHQRLMRTRYLADRALWQAACQLVPSASLQHSVLADLDGLHIPAWLPPSVRRHPIVTTGFRPRLTAVIASLGINDSLPWTRRL